jgi:hypothetical protein
VAQGATTPGAPVTAVLDPNTGVPITLLVTDPNGGIYTSSGNPQGGFGSWSYVNPASGPDFRAAPGSPVTAHATGTGSFTAFATRTDGLVSFTSGTGDSWGGMAPDPWHYPLTADAYYRSRPLRPLEVTVCHRSQRQRLHDLRCKCQLGTGSARHHCARLARYRPLMREGSRFLCS